MLGGALSQQHALVAQEFRRMAAEIGAFLNNKSDNESTKKPSSSKKSDKSAKKKPAKKPAAKKKPAKRVLGGFFDGY